jgi:hypothetical protein
MTRLDEFNLTELGVFIAGVCASVGALLVIIQKSKCEEINCCCLKCKRNIRAIIEQERLEQTGHSGSTPRLSLSEANKIAKEEQKRESLELEPDIAKQKEERP